MTNLNYSTTLGFNLPIPVMKGKDIGSQLVSQNCRLVFTKFQPRPFFSQAKSKYDHSTQSNVFLALLSVISATNSLRQTDLTGDQLLNHFNCNHHNVLDDISPLKLMPKHNIPPFGIGPIACAVSLALIICVCVLTAHAITNQRLLLLL